MPFISSALYNFLLVLMAFLGMWLDCGGSSMASNSCTFRPFSEDHCLVTRALCWLGRRPARIGCGGCWFGGIGLKGIFVSAVEVDVEGFGGLLQQRMRGVGCMVARRMHRVRPGVAGALQGSKQHTVLVLLVRYQWLQRGLQRLSDLSFPGSDPTSPSALEGAERKSFVNGNLFVRLSSAGTPLRQGPVVSAVHKHPPTQGNVLSLLQPIPRNPCTPLPIW